MGGLRIKDEDAATADVDAAAKVTAKTREEAKLDGAWTERNVTQQGLTDASLGRVWISDGMGWDGPVRSSR